MPSSLAEILAEIKADPTLRKTHVRHGCRHCGCFLSVTQEDPTAYHVKMPSGAIEFVIVYRGHFYCRACHKYQANV